MIHASFFPKRLTLFACRECVHCLDVRYTTLILTAVAAFAISFNVSLSTASHLWDMWPIRVDFPWSTWPITTIFRNVLMTSSRLDGCRGRRGFSTMTFSLGDISLSEDELSDTECESSDGMLISASALGSSSSEGQNVTWTFWNW